MSRFKLVLSVTFTALLSSFICANAQAQNESAIVATVPGAIVTPVPAPKETIVVPQGYVSCFNVGAGWYKGVWYPEHRVCQYDPDKAQSSSIQGDAWVDGHWACTKYLSAKGECTNWDWKPGHWVKTLMVY